MMDKEQALARAMSLACWKDPREPAILGGGITNFNVRLIDGERRYVVRIGDDIPVHGVMRFNELAISRAAHAAGIAPAVHHAEPGILVLEFIEGRTFAEADVREPANLERIVALIRRCHGTVAEHVAGPVLAFWVFHVLRDYARTLEAAGSPHLPHLGELLAIARSLERAVGPVELVLGHNDLLPANIIDDGARLWLIDWEYGGYNSPLFDLGGLATNNGLDGALERRLLELYFGEPADDALWRRYSAMKCASLMRETLWSMVSEIHSALDFDYAAYTSGNRARLEAALDDFRQL